MTKLLPLHCPAPRAHTPLCVAPLCVALLASLTAGCTADKDPGGVDAGLDSGVGDGGGSDGGSGDGGADGGSGDGGAPDGSSLRVTAGVDAVVSGGSVVVEIELVDAAGSQLDLDLPVQLWREGVVLGKVVLEDGQATVALPLDGCASAPVDASSDDPAVQDGSSQPVAVAPSVAVVSAPGPAAAAGPLSAVRLALLDHTDAAVDLDLDLRLVDTGSAGAALDAVAEATSSAGAVTFDGLSASGAGRLELSVEGDADCPLAQPVASLLVGEERTVLPVFLESGRVGAEYADLLPVEPELLDPLPAGLARTGSVVGGVPSESGAWLLHGAAWGDGDQVLALEVRLATFPADGLLDDPPLDPWEPGPYDTAATTVVIPAITTSRGLFRNIDLRLAFPVEPGTSDTVAAGPLPVIAFHHAAHSPADIYDDYTDLHAHWASHGILVASVDSQVNVSGQSQSWSNLSDMSDFQLASLDLLRELDADATSPLFGRVDADRLWVSGHSRGGGASLISLWRDARLSGAICFEQVSPLQTPSQDWEDPDGNGDRPFPNRPILFFAGSRDLDEPWPLVDISYEQTVGATAFVTIHGANHEDTYDAGTAGGKTSTSTIPRSARHDVDQHYSTSLLYRFGSAGGPDADPAGDLRFDPLLFGVAALDTDLSPQDVSVHGRRHIDGSLVVDAFQGDPERNELGGDNIGADLLDDDNAEPYEAGLRAVGRYDERGRRVGDWARARLLGWELPDAELALFLDPAGGSIDLTGHDHLVLRLARDCPPPSSGSCPDLSVDVELGLWDADGNELTVAVSEGMGARGIVGRHWGATLLDLDDFAGVDLSRVEGVVVSLATLDWSSGELWLDDLRFE